MSLEVQYKVHAVTQTEVPAQVEYNGQKIVAQVGCLEVELTPVSGNHSSPILRFVGDQFEPAKAKFTQDSIVTWSF